MSQLFKTLSLAPRGIRHKLIVAFALMSLIPMFVFGYFIFYYILPTISTFWDVFSVFVITIFLMMLGFYLAKKIIYPVIELATHAKAIAEGSSLGEVLEVKGEDEIGQLSGSLNRLSARLNENMSELRSYGEKIKQINMEINRKVFALSSLLQIGNLITTATDLSEVLNLIVLKLSQVQTKGAGFLLLLEENTDTLSMRAQANIESKKASQVKIKINQGALGKVFTSAKPLVIDLQKRPKFMDKNLAEILSAKNIAVVPVTSLGKVIGILGVGNNVENFCFSDDEIELIGVFAKQVAVAIENNILLRKTEELAVQDELTGLYNANYIRNRLDEEIKRAIVYQRPCSFIIFELDNFEQCCAGCGEIVAKETLRKIAQILKKGTTEIDRVARFSDHQFAVIMPEKNKRESLHLSEKIRKEIESLGLNQERLKPATTLTLSAGISATPIDGRSSVELINKALSYIKKAKNEGMNKIIVS